MPSDYKIGLMAAIVAVNAACGSVWIPEDYPDNWVTGAVLKPYFLDVDGDGFGDPSEDFKMLAEADTTARYTARNDLDCDDANAKITAHTSAICPADLVPGLAAADIVPVITDVAEYVAIKGGAARNYALHAETACAAWGGQLAIFRSDAEFAAVRDAIGAGKFAGFVGIAQDSASTTCSTGTPKVCWDWTEADGVGFSTIGWCDGLVPGNSYLERAALLNRGAEWCLGAPDGVDGYDWNEAHFICERPIPERVEWWPPPEEE